MAVLSFRAHSSNPLGFSPFPSSWFFGVSQIISTHTEDREWFLYDLLKCGLLDLEFLGRTAYVLLTCFYYVVPTLSFLILLQYVYVPMIHNLLYQRAISPSLLSHRYYSVLVAMDALYSSLLWDTWYTHGYC
jgi:hypothetical protein